MAFIADNDTGITTELDSTPQSQEGPNIRQAEKKCLESLKPLARDISLADRELFDKAVALIRDLGTVAKSRERYERSRTNFSNSYERYRDYQKNFTEFQESHFQIQTKIAVLLGEDPPRKPKAPAN